ncbi:MAG: O-antigen ligase family protein [Chitinophagaceae bacterium]|nr:O-antigen ligase family protein [Chitinophagaceae bacterium]
MERNIIYRTGSFVEDWFKHNFLVRKLNTPTGAILLALLAIAIAYLAVVVDMKFAVAIVAGLAGVLLMVLCLLYPIFGFYLTYFISLFVTLPEKIMNGGVIPMGLVPEYFSYITLVGVITKQEFRKEISRKFWTHGITIWLVVLLLYYLMEFFNPAMLGKLGWFNFIRKQGSLFAFFYISYCIIRSRKDVKHLTNFWIWVSILEAAYACKQQWFGLFSFETRWLLSDPMRIDLFINWGFTRKFGLLSDPASSGVLYAACGNFLLVLALRAVTTKRRIFLYVAAILNLLAASYSGTRTATMMTVAGILFYGIMTLYEKRTIIFMAFCGAMLTIVMVLPIYNNPVINRVRSTFEPSTDNSALVRDINRKGVQPYIYRHPIGGGIYTCGNLGVLYNPGHYLSFVPPDSGYMQILMDQGYIGLILTLIFYYVILKTGIRYFYRVKDPELKTLYAANLAFIFSLMAGQISQMAIPMYPSVFYMYSAFALLLKMHYFDTAKSDEELLPA